MIEDGLYRPGQLHGKRGHPYAATEDEVIQALTDAGGIYSQAAKKLGVSPACITRWVRRSKRVREHVISLRTKVVDMAEIKLFDLVKDGDKTAIIFVLKTLGRDRGYVQRQEVTGADGEPIKVDFTELAKKFEQAVDLEAGGGEE